MTNEEAIKMIWEKLYEYRASNFIVCGDPSFDTAYEIEWAEICEAMAHVTEQLNS